MAQYPYIKKTATLPHTPNELYLWIKLNPFNCVFTTIPSTSDPKKELMKWHPR